MNNASKTAETGDEIDLLLLIERSLAFFKRYIWVFLLAVILGIGMGIWLWSRSSKLYKSRMILKPYMLSNQDFIQVIDNWNNLLKSNAYPTLSSQLDCPEDLLRGVRSIKGNEIQKLFSNNNPSGFYVDVLVKDYELLPGLQKAILYGLNNIDFVKQQLSIKKKSITEMIGQVEMEIKRLDSTKKKVEYFLDKGESRSPSIILDVSGLNGQMISLNEKLLGYQSELQILAAVQVLDGLGKNTKPVGPHLYVLLAISLVFFLALAYIFALFSSINAKLKTRKAGINNG